MYICTGKERVKGVLFLFIYLFFSGVGNLKKPSSWNRYTEGHKATQLHEFGVLEANCISNFITFKNCYQWAQWIANLRPQKVARVLRKALVFSDLNRFSPQDLPLNNYTHKGVSNE